MHARSTAFNTAFAAVLMLLYGWLAGLEGVSKDVLYNHAVDAFKWTLRLGGIAMLLSAVVCYVGLRVGLLLDALVSAGCGVVMFVCVGIWFAKGSGFDIQDIVILIFAIMLLREAWTSFQLYGETSTETAAVSAELTTPAAPHPASLHPSSLPREGEPPPPDGYLSALAKDKDEPPTASYE